MSAAHQRPRLSAVQSSFALAPERGGNFPIFTVLPNFNCHATWWRCCHWSTRRSTWTNADNRLPNLGLNSARDFVLFVLLFLCLISCSDLKSVVHCWTETETALRLRVFGLLKLLLLMSTVLPHCLTPLGQFHPPVFLLLGLSPLRFYGLSTAHSALLSTRQSSLHCGLSLESPEISGNLIAFLLGDCCPVSFSFDLLWFRFFFMSRSLFFAVILSVCQTLFELFAKWPAAFL